MSTGTKLRVFVEALALAQGPNSTDPVALSVAILLVAVLIVHTTDASEAVAPCLACGTRTMHYKAASSITCLGNQRM
jgi:hypothetical protein